MQLAVMNAADRNDELVAYSTSEGAGLCEGQVMRVRGHAATNKARLPQNVPPVIFVPQANCLGQSLDGLLPVLFGAPRSFVARIPLRLEGVWLRQLAGIQTIVERGDPRLEPLLDKL